jgi:hypothetical protein
VNTAMNLWVTKKAGLFKVTKQLVIYKEKFRAMDLINLRCAVYRWLVRVVCALHVQ